MTYFLMHLQNWSNVLQLQSWISIRPHLKTTSYYIVWKLIFVKGRHSLYFLWNTWGKRVFFGMLWNNEILKYYFIKIENILGIFLIYFYNQL
jgi:hypothetical protein